MLYFTVLHYLYDKKLLIQTILVYVEFISLNAQMYENIRVPPSPLTSFLIVLFTFGLSYQNYAQNDQDLQTLYCKLGN
jgi:hypothetical protein